MNASADEKIRVFVAVTPSPEALSTLREIQQSLRQHLPSRAMRWEVEEKWHVTMQFLGDIPAAAAAPLAQALEQQCAGAAPPKIHVQGAGAFPSPRRPRILWAGIDGELEALHELRQRVVAACDSLGFHGDEKPFHPHITLCRVKMASPREIRAAGPALTHLESHRSEPWLADCMEVYQSTLNSQGSRYEQLAQIRFADS